MNNMKSMDEARELFLQAKAEYYRMLDEKYPRTKDSHIKYCPNCDAWIHDIYWEDGYCPECRWLTP